MSRPFLLCVEQFVYQRVVDFAGGSGAAFVFSLHAFYYAHHLGADLGWREDFHVVAVAAYFPVELVARVEAEAEYGVGVLGAVKLDLLARVQRHALEIPVELRPHEYVDFWRRGLR